MKIRVFAIVIGLVFLLFLSISDVLAQTSSKYLYIGNPEYPYNNVAVVDIETDTIVKTIGPIHECEEIYISPDGLQAYVREDGGDVVVIDSSAHRIVESSLGDNPYPWGGMRSIAFSPSTNKVFIGTNNPYQAWRKIRVESIYIYWDILLVMQIGAHHLVVS